MKTYDTAMIGAVSRARGLRRDSTEAERRLWRALREALPAFKWRRQMPVGPYIVDFACFAERLIVEVDGGQHTPEADAERTGFLERQGFRVLRFWNHDALRNTEGVLEIISLSLRERDGAAQRRKGEGDRLFPGTPTSPSHANGVGPSLSQGRGEAQGA